MPLAAAEMPAPGTQARGPVLRVGLEMPGVGDEELELLGLQAAVQRLPVFDLETHPRLRITHVEAPHRTRHQPGGGSRPGAEAQFAGLQAVEQGDLVGQVVRAADQPARMFEDDQALLGRTQVLAARSTRRQPALCSSAWMLRLKADCERLTASAAATKLRCS